MVNVHHIRGGQTLNITYTKGLPMPMFRGSQASIVLAHMERRKLKRLYEQAAQDPEQKAQLRHLGEDWQAFSKTLRQVRSQGYYISRGELDAEVTGIAAPIFGENGAVQASLVIVRDSAQPSRLSEAALINLTVQTAQEISARVT
jgi:DNA-binding IclR family transcriptional regulator